VSYNWEILLGIVTRATTQFAPLSQCCFILFLGANCGENLVGMCEETCDVLNGIGF
jgi:hypothetical protein